VLRLGGGVVGVNPWEAVIRKVRNCFFSHGVIASTNQHVLKVFMAQNRPAKRQCVGVGGADHDPILFVDDFSTVHTREGRLVRVGRDSLSVPTARLAQCEADETWNSAPSWLPADDPQYALDPDGKWYDEVLDGNIMEDLNVHPEDTPATAKGKKRVRSGVLVWSCLSCFGIESDFFTAPASCILEEHPLPNVLGGDDLLGWAGGFLGVQRLSGLRLMAETCKWITSIPLPGMLPSRPHMPVVLCKTPSCPPPSLRRGASYAIYFIRASLKTF